MKPKRIQLSRKKGWRLPENTIVVARPTKWGNPFKIHKIAFSFYNVHEVISDAQAGVCFSRTAAVMQYRRWLARQPELKKRMRRELRGKNLACWCPLDQPCHADVILKVINRV